MVASGSRMKGPALFPRLENETQTQRAKKGPWTSPGPNPHAHLGRRRLGEWTLPGPMALLSQELPWDLSPLGDQPRKLQLRHWRRPTVLGGSSAALRWEKIHWDGQSRQGTHLSLVWRQVLSSQQVALDQMDAVIHGGADEDGQRDGFHGAHLPATPVHDGHHEADDACRGQGKAGKAAQTWPHPHSLGGMLGKSEDPWGMG